MRARLWIGIVFSTCLLVHAQPAYVPLSHPVYAFLDHFATKGRIVRWATAQLPLSRAQIRQFLAAIDTVHLSAAEKRLWLQYKQEFFPPPAKRRVIIFSDSDSLWLFGAPLLGNDEKFVYYYEDTLQWVALEALGSVEWWTRWRDGQKQNAFLTQGGFRLYGDFEAALGYFLQITNGTLLWGDRSVALADPLLQKNVKFALLKSDFDFTESHVRYQRKWFWGEVGRLHRKFGAGVFTGLFTQPQALPYDAIAMGVQTTHVYYTAMVAALLANPRSEVPVGVASEIPPKYYIYHRFAYRWQRGEVGVNEGLIFSDRALELAYLTPLSFLKSLEHSLHDRDNSFLGVDVEYQPFGGLRLYGGFLLDDIIISNIGKGYWSNKTAWNLGMRLAYGAAQLAVEYTRVEPYTFTHFNYQNTPTHDSVIITAGLPPNADRWVVALSWWWGQRYPLQFRISAIRHGENEYDSAGTLIRNVGGNIWQSRRHQDSEFVRFLDGKVVRRLEATLQMAYELRRQWYLILQLSYQERSGKSSQWLAKIFLRFGDW